MRRETQSKRLGRIMLVVKWGPQRNSLLTNLLLLGARQVASELKQDLQSGTHREPPIDLTAINHVTINMRPSNILRLSTLVV
jgi:hypothetical protein